MSTWIKRLSLMFQVSRTDRRLALKDEVLVMRRPGGPTGTLPVAIDVRLLKRHPVYPFSAGQRHYVVVSDRSGANRVFAAAAAWPSQADAARMVDDRGRRWRLTEDALVADDGPADGSFPRVVARRAFWFGWYAQFPDTLLLE